MVIAAPLRASCRLYVHPQCGIQTAFYLFEAISAHTEPHFPISKRRHIALRKTVFYMARGHLLACKRWSLAKRQAITYLQYRLLFT